MQDYNTDLKHNLSFAVLYYCAVFVCILNNLHSKRPYLKYITVRYLKYINTY